MHVEVWQFPAPSHMPLPPLQSVPYGRGETKLHSGKPIEHEYCWMAHSVEQSAPEIHELQLPAPSQTMSTPHDVPGDTNPIE